MSPQLEALAMLNNMFESFDGSPIDKAVLTRRDYALLAQALTARTHFAAPQEERLHAIHECWKAIDAMIVVGDMTGNGCDKTAERNGLILAANAIAAMMAWPKQPASTAALDSEGEKK